MNKMILLIIVLLIMGGGAVWYFISPSEVGTERTATNADGDERAQAITGTERLRDLFMRGADLECDFSQDEDGVRNTGTAYISNGLFRVDAQTLQDGEVFESSMIYDKSAVYAWSTDGEQQFAFMFEIPPEEMESDDAETSEYGQSLDQEAEYSCVPWTVDRSVFVPPADIEFLNMAEMFNAVPGGSQ